MGWVFSTDYLPYNPKLIEYISGLRDNMPEPENKLWFHFLQYKRRSKFVRQHPIDLFIVDFYCSKLGLVIEVDGESHSHQDQIEKDAKRDKILKEIYSLKVIRFSNYDIMRNFEGVCQVIQEQIDQLEGK